VQLPFGEAGVEAEEASLGSTREFPADSSGDPSVRDQEVAGSNPVSPISLTP
jgi:hypothetical protein